MKKLISIQLKNLEDNVEVSTDRQFKFILDLLKKKGLSDNFNITQSRISKKQASAFIDALLSNKQFKVWDYDLVHQDKQNRLKLSLEFKERKRQSKIQERLKINEIKNMPVKKLEFLPSKPKTFDSTPRISLAESEAKLRKLIGD